MAFPTTSVLDDFNRANGGLGSNWTNAIFTTDPDTPHIVSNAVESTSGGAASSWWNVTTFGPNTEAFHTVVTWDTTELFTNLQTPGTTGVDGYRAVFDFGNTLKVFRVDNAVSTQLGGTDTITGVDGDKVGLENKAGVLTGYKTVSGAWGALTAHNDSTYSTGNIGFKVFDIGFQIDNFGGGTIVTSGSFPTTSVLDNFNRVENPLSNGGKWTTPGDDYLSDGTASTNGTQVTLGAASWNVSTFQDAEAYLTLGVSSGFTARTRSRTSSLMMPGNGYAVAYQGAGTSRIFRVDADVETQLGSTVSGITWNAGDVVGHSTIGSAITSYQNGVQIATTTDATYGSAGYIGFSSNNAIDDFGGGTVASTFPAVLAWLAMESGKMLLQENKVLTFNLETSPAVGH